MPENLTLLAIQKGESIRVDNAATHKVNVQATELATLYRSKGMTNTEIAKKLNQIRPNKQFEGKAVFRLLKKISLKTN